MLTTIPQRIVSLEFPKILSQNPICYVWEFQNNALWDTHYHVLLRHSSRLLTVSESPPSSSSLQHDLHSSSNDPNPTTENITHKFMYKQIIQMVSLAAASVLHEHNTISITMVL